jgi:hypothetical protein
MSVALPESRNLARYELLIKKIDTGVNMMLGPDRENGSTRLPPSVLPIGLNSCDPRWFSFFETHTPGFKLS